MHSDTRKEARYKRVYVVWLYLNKEQKKDKTYQYCLISRQEFPLGVSSDWKSGRAGQNFPGEVTNMFFNNNF